METPSQLTKSAEDFGGLRMTKQRKVVYDVLLDLGDKHPTASEIFVSAKEKMPSISLATVYNCLDSLTGAGVIKQVNLHREASRYCANLQPHAHFYCKGCDRVFDIGLGDDASSISSIWDLPVGCRIEAMQVSMSGICGVCPKCNPEMELS